MNRAQPLLVVLGCAVGLSVIAERLPAQGLPRYGIYVGGSALRIRDLSNGSTATLTSGVPSGEAFAWFGRFVVEGYYAQGGLTSETGAATRDFVEGRLLAGYRVLTPLTLKAGPHARSYVLGSGTRRRLFWELRASVETPVAGSFAIARLDLWAALAGQSNISEQVDHARGGEAALAIHIPRSPIWAKLGYRVERAQLDSGTRADTVEGLIFALGVAFPSF